MSNVGFCLTQRNSKIFSIIGALSLALVMSACAKKVEEGTPPDTQGQTPAPQAPRVAEVVEPAPFPVTLPKTSPTYRDQDNSKDQACKALEAQLKASESALNSTYEIYLEGDGFLTRVKSRSMGDGFSSNQVKALKDFEAQISSYLRECEKDSIFGIGSEWAGVKYAVGRKIKSASKDSVDGGGSGNGNSGDTASGGSARGGSSAQLECGQVSDSFLASQSIDSSVTDTEGFSSDFSNDTHTKLDQISPEGGANPAVQLVAGMTLAFGGTNGGESVLRFSTRDVSQGVPDTRDVGPDYCEIKLKKASSNVSHCARYLPKGSVLEIDALQSKNNDHDGKFIIKAVELSESALAIEGAKDFQIVTPSQITEVICHVKDGAATPAQVSRILGDVLRMEVAVKEVATADVTPVEPVQTTSSLPDETAPVTTAGTLSAADLTFPEGSQFEVGSAVLVRTGEESITVTLTAAICPKSAERNLSNCITTPEATQVVATGENPVIALKAAVLNDWIAQLAAKGTPAHSVVIDVLFAKENWSKTERVRYELSDRGGPASGWGNTSHEYHYVKSRSRDGAEVESVDLTLPIKFQRKSN